MRSLQLRLEFLEDRLAPAALTFAVIGDFGGASKHASSTGPRLETPDAEKQVADLVHGWDPSFIVTVGDNNYNHGTHNSIDANIGQYYHDFIHPYPSEKFSTIYKDLLGDGSGTPYGSGSPTGTNRFFPLLGNHEYNVEEPSDPPVPPDAHFDYFQAIAELPIPTPGLNRP